MTYFKDLVITRRSHRKFSSAELDSSAVETILSSALMSPTSKNNRNCQFVLVDDKSLLEKISDSKEFGSQFVKYAPLAIAVIGCPLENDCWVEDCSIAAISMQYQAEELGIGSCWVQIRGRGLSDGTAADEVVKGILNIPDSYNVLCVIALGYKTDKIDPHIPDDLKWENIHINSFE